METLNAYLDDEVEEDAVACRACADMPEQLLCTACELDVPCDWCGGAVAFRSLGTTALLCAACTQRAIEESGVALWLHRAVTVALWTVLLGIEWVAFRPEPAWETTPVGALPGVNLHGTLTMPTVALMLILILVSWAGHDLVDRFAGGCQGLN